MEPEPNDVEDNSPLRAYDVYRCPPPGGVQLPPVPVITEYGPLRHPVPDKLLDLCMRVARAKKVLILAGAGISVSAGLPVFHDPLGPDGQADRNKVDRNMFDFNHYGSDALGIFEVSLVNLRRKCREAEPTPFHHWASSLAHSGRLVRFYSQNFDGLEDKTSDLRGYDPSIPRQPEDPAHRPAQNIMRLHGDIRLTICDRGHMDWVKGEHAVSGFCEVCVHETAMSLDNKSKRAKQKVGNLNTAILLYNDKRPLDQDDPTTCIEYDFDTVKPDLYMIVGTSLNKAVKGARDLVNYSISRAQASGASVVWLNPRPPPPAVKDHVTHFPFTADGFAASAMLGIGSDQDQTVRGAVAS